MDWTAPYAHRSMKTVSGFSPSIFLAASMTGSITNILLNAMVMVYVDVCNIYLDKETKQCGNADGCAGTCMERIFRSCAGLRREGPNQNKSRRNSKSMRYRRRGGMVVWTIPGLVLFKSSSDLLPSNGGGRSEV